MGVMGDVGGGTVIITADYFNHYWQVTTQIRWGAEARFVLAMHSPRKEGRTTDNYRVATGYHQFSLNFYHGVLRKLARILSSTNGNGQLLNL